MATDAGPRRRHALGVDFGTSNTVAVARWPDGRARPILIDGSPLLPSAVYAQPDGQLIVGRDAVHSARLDPARFEPNPKRRVDDGTVLLGDREVPVADLFTAVLARVAEEWHRAVGPVRPDVTLTCPATWGATRRTLLAEAAAGAGLSGARLVAEPVAAATYFAEVLGRDVPIGSVVVVHDFGAGTFDASVVARRAEGFEVLAVDGRDDVGGLDVDAAVVEHLGRLCAGRDAAGWQRLSEPSTVEERRAQRQLWDDVRVAKERLSRTQTADLVIPLLDIEVHLTRDELEALAGPLLKQTVQVTQDVLRWVGLAEGRLAGVFLVGGASRIPLVATLLHRALGEAPVVIEQPELVVAEGSILADAALLATGPAAPGLTGEMRLVSGMPPMPPATGGRWLPVGSTPTADPADADTVRGPSPLSGSPVPWDAPTTPGGRTAAGAGRTVAGQTMAGPTMAGPTMAGPTMAGPTMAGPTMAGPTMAGPTVVGPTVVGPMGAAGGATGSAAAWAVDDAETVRDPIGMPPPAVDPWPHARAEQWTPDPDYTLLTEPSSPRESPRQSPPALPRQSSRRQSGARESGARESGLREPTLTDLRPVGRPEPEARSAQKPRTAGKSRPASEPRSAEQVRPLPQVRPVPQARPAQQARPAKEARPAKASRPRKRTGRLVRFLQVVLSMIFLVTVPVGAMIVAYGHGNGYTPLQDADRLARDIIRLVSQL